MKKKNIIEVKSFLIGFLCGFLVVVSYCFYYQSVEIVPTNLSHFSNKEFIDQLDDFSEIFQQNNDQIDDEDQSTVTLSQEQLFNVIANDSSPSNDTHHKFHPLNQQIFYTPQERLDFFNKMGLVYCNQTAIDYLPIVDTDPRRSERYNTDPDYYDFLTELYGNDIQSQTLMPMSIRWISPEVGHGIFAEDDLPQGGFVGIYGGLIKDKSLVTNKDYAWSYPGQTLENGPISLDALEHRNELAFVNDGKDPNCIVQYIIGPDNLWHVCYLAIKDITKGEQLLVSYGNAYWDTRQYGYQNLAE